MKDIGEYSQLIQEYFDGTLNEHQRLELEALVAEHPEVAMEFNTMRMAIDSIKEIGFRRMLEGFERKAGDNKTDADAGSNSR